MEKNGTQRVWLRKINRTFAFIQKVGYNILYLIREEKLVLRMKEKNSMRQRIIDSAWELFYEKGYEETTIMDIVQKSGVAKRSFY